MTEPCFRTWYIVNKIVRTGTPSAMIVEFDPQVTVNREHPVTHFMYMMDKFAPLSVKSKRENGAVLEDRRSGGYRRGGSR
ncbi:hypothetical protein NKDENANG_01163 [Candidatus Entotheonellaceae bacterium PAL068K]